MSFSASSREEHLLTIGICSLLDDRYDALPWPGRVIQLVLTNLRNRPLSHANLNSMRDAVLSLYHSLITSSHVYPLIPFRGSFRTCQVITPFVEVEPELLENTAPSPLMEGPSGRLVLPPRSPDSSRRTRSIVFPAHPEKTEILALMADNRNRVHRMEVNGRTVFRVISPVYHADRTVMTNRWRLSDYRPDGQVLMSCHCHFTTESAQYSKPQSRKRKQTEENSSSSPSPATKRLRL